MLSKYSPHIQEFLSSLQVKRPIIEKVIRVLKDDGRVHQVSLEEYLEDLHASCACLAEGQRLCICSKEDRDVSSHLALLEEDGFSRARINDKDAYRQELTALSKKRPVLLRCKKEETLPF